MNRKILITGTTSYVGTSFANYIEEINGNMPSEKRWHVTFVSMRNDDWKQMDFSEYHAILHVAGIVHRKEEPDMRKLYDNVNTKLTVELAKKAKEEGVRQFIFLSTMSVYGIVKGRITKTTKPTPKTFYGISKLAAEDEIKPLRSEDFQVAIVRPPMIYGRECTGNYRLLEKVAVKLPFFPKVKNERSMLYIDNLSEFMKRVIETEASGIFFPQNKEYVNTSEMVSLIRKSYGKKGVGVPGFGWMIKLLATRMNLFAKVFGTLTYSKEMSEYTILGDYQIVDFGESINGSKK